MRLTYETACNLIRSIQRYLAHVEQTMIQASLVFEDRLNTIAYTGFRIVCLTSLVNIYAVLAQGNGPWSLDMKRRLLETVRKIVALSETFMVDDYDYLDVWLYVRIFSCISSLTISDTEIN